MPAPSRFSLRAISFAIATTSAALTAPASASMNNIAHTYGLMPLDVGSALAFSMFNKDISATYYNPAYLVQDPRGELTGGTFHGTHDLRGSSPDREGSIVSDSPTQHVLIGVKANLTSLTRFEHPLQIGVMAGIEKFSRELLAFESNTSSTGQFLQYDRQPLFLTIGGGTKLWRGIDGGFSTRLTLHSEANLTTSTDLAGNTEYENLSVEAKPSIRSIISTNIDWGQTICPDSPCFLDGFETAFSYRTSSSTRTKVYANTSIPGLIPSSDPLVFDITTHDSFQPSMLSAGFQYSTNYWRLALAVEQQNWSDLEEQFETDDVKDQANAKFNDIIVPRLGAEYRFGPLRFFAGVAYQESALDSDSTLDVNYFDNDKIIWGIGQSLLIKKMRHFTYPIQLDISYQRHMLQDRDFTISTSDPDAVGTNNEVVTTSGTVHVVNGSITFKF